MTSFNLRHLTTSRTPEELSYMLYRELAYDIDYEDILKYVAAGADPLWHNERTGMNNFYYYTQMYIHAGLCIEEKIFDYFLKQGADINSIHPTDKDTLLHVCMDPPDLGLESLNSIELLLNNKINPYLKNEQNRDAIEEGIWIMKKRGTASPYSPIPANVERIKTVLAHSPATSAQLGQYIQSLKKDKTLKTICSVFIQELEVLKDKTVLDEKLKKSKNKAKTPILKI